MAPSMDPVIAGLGLNLAADGKFKAGEAASILGTTSAVMSSIEFGQPFLKSQRWIIRGWSE